MLIKHYQHTHISQNTFIRVWDVLQSSLNLGGENKALVQLKKAFQVSSLFLNIKGHSGSRIWT